MVSMVLGNADLSFWPQVALVIFFAVFVAVAAQVLRKEARKDYSAAARLPLED